MHSDHLNTPRLMTNAQNQPAWQWAYSAFGDNEPSVAARNFRDRSWAFANGELRDLADGSDDADNGPQFGRKMVKLNLRYPGQYFDDESNLHYNYRRTYDARTGRYTQPDPIGLAGGWNQFGYVEGNPLSMTDPWGLKGAAGAAGGARPSNARDAAGFHDPRGDFVCEQWDCPANSGACSRGDTKQPTDFLPPATSAAAAPDGCKCTKLGYRRDWNPPTPEERDLAEAYNNYKEGQSMSSRLRNALGRLPMWHRLGGYAK